MKRDIRYIIKRVIIGLLIILILSFVRNCEVKAAVYVGGTKLTSQNYKVLNQGNTNVAFGNDQVYSSLATFPSYYRITFCSDVSAVNSWYSTNNASSIPYLIDVDFYVTNYSCKFPNSTYTGGHVVYVYGTSNPATACSTSGTNCYQSATTTRLVFYNPAGSSWAILNEAYSQEPYEMDYASQTIITSNDALVDSQDYANGLLDRITQQNINTYNMQQNEFNQTQDKIDNINSSITNDNISGAESSVNSLLDNAAFQDSTGLTAVISTPLNFISNLSNTCSPISLTLPYFKNNTQVTLPCISSLLQDKIPTVKSLLVVVINGFIVYRILIELFYIVKSARNPEDDRIEVLDL